MRVVGETDRRQIFSHANHKSYCGATSYKSRPVYRQPEVQFALRFAVSSDNCETAICRFCWGFCAPSSNLNVQIKMTYMLKITSSSTLLLWLIAVAPRPHIGHVGNPNLMEARDFEGLNQILYHEERHVRNRWFDAQNLQIWPTNAFRSAMWPLTFGELAGPCVAVQPWHGASRRSKTASPPLGSLR